MIKIRFLKTSPHLPSLVIFISVIFPALAGCAPSSSHREKVMGSLNEIIVVGASAKLREEALEEAFAILYPSTGRALFFNFTAVLFGFGVLLSSDVPPLNRFGALVGVAVFISFVASLTMLPALIKLTRPAFLFGARKEKLDAREGDVALETAN